MGNETQNTGAENEKVLVQTVVVAPLRVAIDAMANKERRSRSSMVELLLETHPRVKRQLEQAEGAAA